jgi:hypothetical protein
MGNISLWFRMYGLPLTLLICFLLLALTSDLKVFRNLPLPNTTTVVRSGLQTKSQTTQNTPNLVQEPFDRLSFLSWELHEGFPRSHQSGRPRLLIAQTISNFYAPLLDAGQPVNQAYARVYGHDYVVARGIYLVNERINETQLTAPDSRASYNKIALLSYALREGKYDKLLVLDSDAIISDFDIDFATFGLDPEVMLFAQAVDPSKAVNYWDINNGVTLWNLHHGLFVPTWYEWYSRSMKNVYSGNNDKDQGILHSILRQMPNESRPVRRVKHFCCYRGALIQHFIRKNTTDFMVLAKSRLENLKAAANYTLEYYTTLINQTINQSALTVD